MLLKKVILIGLVGSTSFSFCGAMGDRLFRYVPRDFWQGNFSQKGQESRQNLMKGAVGDSQECANSGHRDVRQLKKPSQKKANRRGSKSHSSRLHQPGSRGSSHEKEERADQPISLGVIMTREDLLIQMETQVKEIIAIESENDSLKEIQTRLVDIIERMSQIFTTCEEEFWAMFYDGWCDYHSTWWKTYREEHVAIVVKKGLSRRAGRNERGSSFENETSSKRVAKRELQEEIAEMLVDLQID